MNFTLEESNTEKVSPILDEIIRKILYQSKCSESRQKDFLFVLIIVLMIENGFYPMKNRTEIIENIKSIDAEQLRNWKTAMGAMEAIFVLNGFENIPVKLIISPLGATAVVNLVIYDLDSETYSVCLPMSRFVVSPQASSIPMIFRDLKHLSVTFKNKIISAVKSRILTHCGYASASLMGLPEEVVYEIMRRLPVADVVNTSLTCRRLRFLIGNTSLWHELYKRDFGNVDTERSDWKTLYKEKYTDQRENRLRQISRAAGTMHDYMDYSDYISYIDNPMWDIII